LTQRVLLYKEENTIQASYHQFLQMLKMKNQIARPSPNAGGNGNENFQSLWPIRLGETESSFASAAVGNVIGDSSPEVVVPVVDNPFIQSKTTPGLYVYHSDGSPLGPRRGLILPLSFGPQNLMQPVTLANLDDDPSDQEILYYDDNFVYALKGNGQACAGHWPLAISEGVGNFNSASFMVTDVNSDQKPDVVFASAYNDQTEKTKLYVVDRFGRMESGWPVSLTKQDFGIEVRGNLVGNFDPATAQLEIIASSYPIVNEAAHKIVSFDYQGHRLWEKDYNVVDMVGGDIDHDGKTEVVVLGSPYVDNNFWKIPVLVLDGKTGATKQSFEETAGEYLNDGYYDQDNQTYVYENSRVQIGQEGRLSQDNLFLGDFNRNARAEILFHYRYSSWKMIVPMDGGDPIIQTYEDHSKVMALSPELQRVGPTLYFDQSWGDIFAEPEIIERIVDLNGDGFPELVTSHLKDLFDLDMSVWNKNGNEIASTEIESQTREGDFTRMVSNMKSSFYDLQGNGLFDLFVPMAGGELHRLSGQRPSPLHHQDWAVYRQNNQRTGFWVDAH